MRSSLIFHTGIKQISTKYFPKRPLTAFGLMSIIFQCKRQEKIVSSKNNIISKFILGFKRVSAGIICDMHWYTLIWSSITIDFSWYANEDGFHFMRYQNRNMNMIESKTFPTDRTNGGCECKHNALSLKAATKYYYTRWYHEDINIWME